MAPPADASPRVATARARAALEVLLVADDNKPLAIEDEDDEDYKDDKGANNDEDDKNSKARPASTMAPSA